MYSDNYKRLMKEIEDETNGKKIQYSWLEWAKSDSKWLILYNFNYMGNLKNEHNNKTETFLDYEDKYLVANRGQD